jgi:hypothetical protein
LAISAHVVNVSAQSWAGSGGLAGDLLCLKGLFLFLLFFSLALDQRSDAIGQWLEL